jgi:uncharacterized membrane protein
MQQVIYALFDDYQGAHTAVSDLEQQGYQQEDMTVITQASTLPAEPVAHENIDDGATEGAGVGASIGGLTGLIAGIGAITMPGFGPLLAVGPLLTALSAVAAGAGLGAVTGGLVGALVDWGIPDKIARTYSRAIGKGSVLVAIAAGEHNVEAVETILAQHDAHDINVYELATKRERARTR